MRNRPLLLCFVVALACESGPPVKTASGQRVAGVTIEERFPLSDNVYEMAFRGERLRKAVELMDKHGVFALSGSYEASGALDTSTVTITIVSGEEKDKGDKERRIVVKNCAETKFCAFAEEAKTTGIIDKQPKVCRTAQACSHR